MGVAQGVTHCGDLSVGRPVVVHDNSAHRLRHIASAAANAEMAQARPAQDVEPPGLAVDAQAGLIHVPDRNLWAAQQRLNPVGHGPQGRCGSGDERRQRCRTDVDAVKVGKYLRQTVVGDAVPGLKIARHDGNAVAILHRGVHACGKCGLHPAATGGAGTHMRPVLGDEKRRRGWQVKDLSPHMPVANNAGQAVLTARTDVRVMVDDLVRFRGLAQCLARMAGLASGPAPGAAAQTCGSLLARRLRQSVA